MAADRGGSLPQRDWQGCTLRYLNRRQPAALRTLRGRNLMWELLDMANKLKDALELVGIVRQHLPPEMSPGKDKSGEDKDPIQVLEVEDTGLLPGMAAKFVEDVRESFEQQNAVDVMRLAPPYHPKMDILTANPGQLETFHYNTIPSYDFRDLRGDPYTSSHLLSRDVGMRLGGAQTHIIFNMVEKESVQSEHAQIGNLRYRIEQTIEDMKAEGFKPSVIALPWKLNTDVLKQLDISPLPAPSPLDNPPKTCFTVFKDTVLDLPVIREPEVAEGRLYVIDLEAFCKVRYDKDNLLECVWYTRPSYDEDHLGFLAKMHYKVTLKNRAASRRILVKAADEPDE